MRYGMPRRVGVPGQKISHLSALAEQVFADPTRPDETIRAKELERAGLIARGQSR
jgi:hypothetical protein